MRFRQLGAATLKIEPSETRSSYSVDAEIHFELERQYPASFRSRGREHCLFVKGVPERLLSTCDKLLMDEGPMAPDPLRIAVRIRRQSVLESFPVLGHGGGFCHSCYRALCTLDAVYPARRTDRASRVDPHPD